MYRLTISLRVLSPASWIPLSILIMEKSQWRKVEKSVEKSKVDRPILPYSSAPFSTVFQQNRDTQDLPPFKSAVLYMKVPIKEQLREVTRTFIRGPIDI